MATRKPAARTRSKPEATRRSRVKKEEVAPAKRRSRAVKEEAPAKRSRKAAPEREAKPARGRKKVTEEAEPAFNPYSKIDDAIDAIEKDYALSGSGLSNDEARMSTNNFTQDLILGGGIVGGGWYTIFGGEQSCKSTDANSIMLAGVVENIPIIQLWDYEGSSSPEYLENMLRTNNIKQSVEDVFGIRDPKSGHWVVPPRVRYYAESVAEKFFDSLAKLTRRLPDKRKIGDSWYFVYESKVLGKDNKLVVNKSGAEIVGNNFDKNYFAKTGKWRVPAPDGNLQALLILDSYPAMLPEKQDVDDPGSAMAVQARMFSEQIKRVKGKLKGKRIAVIGVNQLRDKPMVMFGSPEYEPCGQALKFYSDVRLRLQSRALSAVVNGAKGGEEIEASVTTEGNDSYRYIHIRATKNKLSVPNLEGFIRLWISDAEGQAQGFDPVFDTYQYLTMTGQVTGSRNKMRLQLHKQQPAKTVLSWLDFKRMILCKNDVIKKICARIGIKPLSLRKMCRTQLKNGTGTELMFAAKRAAVSAKKEAVVDDTDDE